MSVEVTGLEPSGKTPQEPGTALRSALEGCCVLFFLQVQQLAAIRDSLEARGEQGGPGTPLGTIAFMKREIKSQWDVVQQALKSPSPEGSPSPSLEGSR